VIRVKRVESTDGAWVLEVLGIPYGGPYGGRDAQGEYFTQESDLWLERIARRPVVYYHGLAEGEAAPQVIGEELGWERRDDGVWFRVALDQGKALARRVWEAAQAGFARASSGAIAHLVRVAADGRILSWPVGELSLLDAREHQPANPFAVAVPYRVEAARAKAAFEAAGLRGAEAFEGAGRTQGWIRQIDTSAHGEDQRTMDEMTLRAVMRQEIAGALDARGMDGNEGPAALLQTRQAPALIRERGERALSANNTPFVDAIKALRQGRFDVVRFQLAGKALAEGSDESGGYLVPVEQGARLVEMLRARTAVRAAGATVVPMAGDTLQIPAQAGGATAYWVAENSAITGSDQTWGQVMLQAKKLAALTKLSSELFEDSDPGVEALVMADLARVLALEEDLKYLTGDGTGNTPTGLEHISGVNVDTTTLGDNGGVPDFDDLADLLYRLDADNVAGEGRAWIMHPRTLNTLRKIKKDAGSADYVWSDPAAPGDPPSLWGLPVYATTAISIAQTRGTSADCSTVYLGCWPDFVIGQRKALELRASDAAGSAFEYDQVFIRAIMRVDCNVRHAASFEALKGVRA